MKWLVSVATILAAALPAAGCKTTFAPAEAPRASIAAAPSGTTESAPSNDSVATKLASLVEAMDNIKPGERPPLSSDEAGWWMTMDKVERQTSTAGNLVRDLVD